MPPSHLRHDSDTATGTACDTFPMWEQKSPATQRPCQSLPPALPEKLSRVRLRGHTGVKNLWCFLSRRRYVLICRSSHYSDIWRWSAAATSQVARRHMRTRLDPNNPRNQCPANLISILPMSFWKGELSTILMALFLDEMQDSDSERKQERIQTGREEEKKENDMIIFQEMITIPNQEEIDELVGGRSTCRFVIPRCK